MSKSTSGAYGDFPDYYYESGNQFGAYLLGRAPAPSWDLRMEATLVAPGGPYVAPPRRAGTGRLEQPVHEQLMTWVRGTISRRGARRILASLATERGFVLPDPLGDPYDALDVFVLQLLSETQQRKVLNNLRDAYARATRPRPLAAGKETTPKRGAARPRRRNPSVSRKPEQPSGPVVCSLCGTELTVAERASSRASASLFLGQAYCNKDAKKVRRVLGVRKDAQ